MDHFWNFKFNQEKTQIIQKILNYQNSKESYTKHRNKLTKVLRAAEKKYYSDKFISVKDNIRDTWKLINKVLNDTTGAGNRPSITKIKHNGGIIDNQKIIADKFNDYFVNIGPNLAKTIPPVPNGTIKDTLPPSNSNSIFVNPCTSNEILTIVKSLKNTKGIGLDGFSTAIVKQIITKISDPLATIFNKSMASGIFPHKLKLAKVIPMYKSG